jgi:TetR/AcrR family transcriptional regulator, regulator of mycofactocin system
MSTEDNQSRIGRRRSTTHAELERIAFDLFAIHGFDETSVDDIALEAGIGRRTFFRYYPSKADLVWGDFTLELERMRRWLAAAPETLPMMNAVQQAVLEFNRLPPEQVAQHRRRLALILGVPTLLANSTLRFVQWREVIAEFAALRLGLDQKELLPKVIGYAALGAALAGYEQWLDNEGSDLTELLGAALGELATGFDHHDRSD